MPLPPGAIQFAGDSQKNRLLHTDENRLLAGAELMHHGGSGQVGAWLQTACAWGRIDRSLTEKQDRVATRLMNSQDDDGYLGARSANAPWTVLDTRAQASCLSGLVAYYTLTHRPAAIYAAMSGADLLLSEHHLDPSLIYPLTRLYQATGDARYLAASRQQAREARPDGLGLSVLYEATGKGEYLEAARRAWDRDQNEPELSAELLLLTGRPGYAAILNQELHPGPEMLRAAWTRIPHGIALSTVRDCTARLPSIHIIQQTSGRNVRTVTIHASKAATFTLQLYLPVSPTTEIRVNGIPQTTLAKPGSYIALTRRWRNGDVVTCTSRSLIISRLP